MKLLGLATIAFMLAGAFHSVDERGLDRTLRGPIEVVSPAAADVCGVAESFDQLAQQAELIVGFEQVRECWFSKRSPIGSRARISFSQQPIRQMLDRLVSVGNGFSWRDVDGVPVVRPIAAWNDPNDVLNRQVRAFKVVHATLTEAIHSLLDAAIPPIVYSPPPVHEHTGTWPQTTMSFAFSSGTMLEAINRITTQLGSAEWQLSYRRGRPTLAVLSSQHPTKAFLESLADGR